MYESNRVPDVSGEDISPERYPAFDADTGAEEGENDVRSVRLIRGQFRQEELQYYRDAGYLVVREPWGYMIYDE